jgi:hypothetical protein
MIWVSNFCIVTFLQIRIYQRNTYNILENSMSRLLHTLYAAGCIYTLSGKSLSHWLLWYIVQVDDTEVVTKGRESREKNN